MILTPADIYLTYIQFSCDKYWLLIRHFKTISFKTPEKITVNNLQNYIHQKWRNNKHTYKAKYQKSTEKNSLIKICNFKKIVKKKTFPLYVLV